MKTFLDERGKVKRIFYSLLLSLCAVFLLRLGYEVFFTDNDILFSYPGTINGWGEDGYGSRLATKNIATDKVSQKNTMGQNITIDQKYDKTAGIASVTSDFQADNERLRTVIRENQAVIQSEYLTGLEGSQRLTMMIGVCRTISRRSSGV